MRGLKEGDIFEVHVGGAKQFIQYLATDKTCLNGHVIRAFDWKVGLDDVFNLNEVVTKRAKFYTHTSLPAGVKLNAWKKIGNVPLPKELILPFFRQSEDYGNPEIKKSFKWYIWKVNGPTIDIGELKGEHKDLDVGGLTHPLDLVARLKSGHDTFIYPS